MKNQRDIRRPDPPTPIPWGRIAILAGIAIGLIALAIVLAAGPGGLQRSRPLRLDALRLGLTGIAGYGAAVTLWLALRRQQHHEAQQWMQREVDLDRIDGETRDARSRRAMELYSAASDQLASPQPVVRLAGLYSFERLAIDDADYRQTVTDVLCAYLRMSNLEASADASEAEVRRAAQALILRHMRPPSDADAWNCRVNLAGAHLADFDASAAHFGDINFTGATFTGEANFNGATFHRKAHFYAARFTGPATFRGAGMEAAADFDCCRFSGPETAFTRARFSGSAMSFRSSHFLSPQTIFRGAHFDSVKATNFNGSVFGARVTFKRCRFTSEVTSFARVDPPSDQSMFLDASFSGLVLVDADEEWAPLFRRAKVPPTPVTTNVDGDSKGVR